jgi:23S rRNA C2498 (ribose-2'-O)-methylase RlmM
MYKYEDEEILIKRIAMQVLLFERQLNKNDSIKQIDVVRKIKKIIDREVK